MVARRGALSPVSKSDVVSTIPASGAARSTSDTNALEGDAVTEKELAENGVCTPSFSPNRSQQCQCIE